MSNHARNASPFSIGTIVSDKLELVEKNLSLVNHSDAAPDVKGFMMAANFLLAWCKGDYESAIQNERQAVKFLSPEQSYLRGLLAFSSGASYEMIGKDDAAFQSLQEAKQHSHAFGNRTAELSTLKKLGDFQMRCG